METSVSVNFEYRVAGKGRCGSCVGGR